MSFNPSDRIQDDWVFGEFGGVNPSINDSVTYTFFDPETMQNAFHEFEEGCFLYARQWNPSTKALADSLAAMEDADLGLVTSSGMAAISNVFMQLCQQGDEIVSSRTVYGGTYALLKHFMPQFGVHTTFVDATNLDSVRAAITPKTKVLYVESISNPLLEVADIPALSALAHEHNIPLVVDNTFSPLVLSPIRLGADIVVHSMTKYINGSSDALGGCVVGRADYIEPFLDTNFGTMLVLGPVLDGARAASIRKNLNTLSVRMMQHSHNAQYLAEQLSDLGLKVHYPGLPQHPQHELIQRLWNPGFGFSGMLVLDVDTADNANKLVREMQLAKVGYLAVSLGFHKTLFSTPGSSTSSEIPPEEQEAMGLSPGMIRVSVGLDHNMERTFQRMKGCLEKTGLLMSTPT